MEPEAFMLAADSALVCTRSPKKRADDLAMLWPLSNAVPWLYTMAAGRSAANKETGRIRIKTNRLLRIFTYTVLVIRSTSIPQR
jgi:hypothetical protein